MYEQLPKFVREPDPRTYLGRSYVVIDFETTSLEKGSALDGGNKLLLACWVESNYAGGRHCGTTWGDEFSQGALIRAIKRSDFIVCHNTKFELQWLRRCGIDLRRVLPFDTLIAEKVIHGNIKTPLSLDATAKRRGLGQKDATASHLIKAGVCPSEIPRQMLEDYCRMDVALTEAIFLQQREELEQLGLLPVAYCRNLVTPVLADIEFNGMTLDAERVKATTDDYLGRYTELEKQFRDFTGGINPKSPKQMREYIYEKLGFERPTDYKGRELVTSTGEAKADKATILSLRATTDEQKEFKRLATEIAKLKVPVQNLKKMQAIVEANPDDPRVFATYNQTVTQTDRLSSTGRKGGFQFHNFDRAFKPIFRARSSGRVICEADAPQLEFRVAAFLGNDAQAISDIRNGVDIHAATAKVFGIKRQDAKAKTFAPLYGATSGDARTVKYRDYFRERYAGIFGVQSKWTYDVARDKYLTTRTGLRFYWPDTVIKSGGYVTNSTAIFNYPIQSLATADVIPLTLCLIWHRIGHLGNDAIIVNTIHDSVIADVKESALAEYKRIVVECFTIDIYKIMDKLYNIKLDVPLGVGIKSAEHWGEGEEEKHETF